MLRYTTWFAAAALAFDAPVAAQDRLQSSDLLRLRSVSAVQLSPDAARVAYTVENNDGAGRPFAAYGHWVRMSAAYDVIFLAAAVLLFDYVLDD